MGSHTPEAPPPASITPEPAGRPWYRRSLPVLLFIFGIAVGLRVGLAVFSGPTWFAIDTQIYLEQGRRIAEGSPSAYFPNGFPLLIAFLWLLVGQAGVPEAIVVVNVLASLGVVMLVYAIGRKVAGRSVGVLAALAVAIYPNQLNFVRLLMSEVTATVLLVAAIYLLLRHHALWSGFVLGLAVLVRTTLLPVVPALLVVMLVYRDRREVGTFTLGTIVVAGLHALLLVSGTITPPQNLDYNVLLSISATSSEGMDFSRSTFQSEFSEEEKAHPFATYVRFAAAHPGVFFKQRISALWELWGPWPAPGDPAHPRRFLVRLLIGLRFLLIVPAMWAFVRHIREEQTWVLALPILVITAVHTAFFATPRFTYVVEPLVIVLAMWLVVDLWRRSPRRLETSPSLATDSGP